MLIVVRAEPGEGMRKEKGRNKRIANCCLLFPLVLSMCCATSVAWLRVATAMP